MPQKKRNDKKAKEIRDPVKSQYGLVRDNYMKWLELTESMWLENLKAFEAQMDVWLSLQKGYLDFVKMISKSKPDPGVNIMDSSYNPFVAQMDYLTSLQKDIIDLKKRKAQKLTKGMIDLHKRNIEKTLSSFDKYLDLLSTV